MPKEITIITGFLGAGKTTFLNKVLEAFSSTKFAIIENEFGKIGIDADLIIKPDNSIYELSNGCLCCNLNDDLYDILNELTTRQDDFEQLLIETTGIADPAGVAEPFLTDSELKKHFSLSRVICIVDAINIENQLLETEEAIKQIVFSDIILVNKIEGVADEKIQNILSIIQGFNPFAKVFCVNDNTDLTIQVFNIYRDQDFKSGVIENKVLKSLILDDIRPSFNHGSLQSISFSFDRPFNEQKLQMRLFGFLVFEAKDVYRIKGIIQGNNIKHRLIVQSVAKNLSIIGGKPWMEEELKESKIVFIGKNLDKVYIESLLNDCLVD